MEMNCRKSASMPYIKRQKAYVYIRCTVISFQFCIFEKKKKLNDQEKFKLNKFTVQRRWNMNKNIEFLFYVFINYASTDQKCTIRNTNKQVWTSTRPISGANMYLKRMKTKQTSRRKRKYNKNYIVYVDVHIMCS